MTNPFSPQRFDHPGSPPPPDPPGPPHLPPPPPPPPAAPRALRADLADWNSGFAVLWGGGYGGIPAIVLIVLLFSMGPPWNDLLLDQRGVTVQAQPYAVEGTGVEVNDESVMRVKIRFRDKKGQNHDTGLTTTDAKVLQQAAQHQPMEIDYDPEAPSVARFHGHKSTFLSEGGAFVVPMLLFVFIIPGLSSLAWGLLRIRKRRAVYRDGVAALATIVHHAESKSSENDEYLINARYEFSTPTGPQSGIIKALQPPPVGTRLWVIYSPAQPDLNLPA